jgi:hypothetical protein
MPNIARMFSRLYMQYLAIILIAVVFAYVLNAVFSIDETETRIMFTSLFLAAFAIGIMAIEKKMR